MNSPHTLQESTLQEWTLGESIDEQFAPGVDPVTNAVFLGGTLGEWTLGECVLVNHSHPWLLRS